jgi:hypothetical protein
MPGVRAKRRHSRVKSGRCFLFGQPDSVPVASFVLGDPTSSKPVLGQRVVVATIPGFSLKDKDEVFAPPSTVRSLISS